jgi:hypothetical protein
MAKGKYATALFDVIRKDRPLTRQKDRGLLEVITGGPGPAEAAPPVPGGAPPEAPVGSPPREMLIRLTYPSAIVAGMALATIVGGAFMAGQKSVRNVRPAISLETGDEVRQQQPQPDVVNVAHTIDRPGTGETADNPGGAGHGKAAATDAGLAAAKGRINGANYIIIQSYPEQERKMAEDAVKFLHDNGIEATIEKDLPRWGLAGWYTVLGTTGFEKISSSQCEAYSKKVRDISERYA